MHTVDLQKDQALLSNDEVKITPVQHQSSFYPTLPNKFGDNWLKVIKDEPHSMSEC